MRPLLRYRDFRLLFAGLTCSRFGDSAMVLLFGIWVRTLTGSNSAAGLTLLVMAVAGMPGPVAGYLVDRVRKRPFLIWANLVAAAAMLPLLAVHGRMSCGCCTWAPACTGCSRPCTARP
jgi:predicted MFS family arabinose efflux permease